MSSSVWRRPGSSRVRHGRAAAGRTVLLVTHRLSTAMHADMVLVLVDGRVRESGSHTELLAAGGYYAQSWVTQEGPSR